MSYVRAKICGITREEDALRAVRHGADAVGFVLWPGSPRSIALDRVATITRMLPPFVWRVGVFVNASPDEVETSCRVGRLNVAQLHGDEDVEKYRHLHLQIVKAMSVTSDDDVARALALPSDVMVMVDAHDPERHGGTGKLAAWDYAAAVASVRPVMLAGGLNAENVVDAVERVRPWGVDASSSLEQTAGVKNASKLAVFFAALEPMRSVKRV